MSIVKERKAQQKYIGERDYIFKRLQDDNIKTVINIEIMKDKKYIYIHDIPFRFLNFRGNAANLRIGNSVQKLFIPRIYFNNDGTLKDTVDPNSTLDWWFYKQQVIHQIKLYIESIELAHLEAADYAYEKQYEYEQRVGDFYMQDPAEQDASNQVYEEEYNSKLKETIAITKLDKFARAKIIRLG